MVLLLPTGCRGLWISNANHCGFHSVADLNHFYVIIVGKVGVLVQVVHAALYRAWFGAASPGDHVNDAILKEALVIVDVSRHYHKAYPRLLWGLGQEVSQSFLVRPAVVATASRLLHVYYRRMMEIEKHEAHGRGQTGQLASHPGRLLAARHQGR